MRDAELFNLIAKLRLAMPRNVLVMELCREAERLSIKRQPKRDRAQYMRQYRAREAFKRAQSP